MLALKKVRHEQFAQNLAQGLTPEKAYVAAGYKGNRRHAHRLLGTNGDIKARVEELRKQAIGKIEISIERVAEELAKIAFGLGQFEDAKLSDRRAALADLAKYLGMFVERTEVGAPGEFNGMTTEQKRERALSLARQIGLGVGNVTPLKRTA